MTDEDKKDFEETNKEAEEANVSEGENKPDEVTQNQSEVENTTNPTEKSENADETSNIDNQNQNLEENANQNDSSDEEKKEIWVCDENNLFESQFKDVDGIDYKFFKNDLFQVKDRFITSDGDALVYIPKFENQNIDLL